jgi:uncharacterized RDD family membrane protein YckC
MSNLPPPPPPPSMSPAPPMSRPALPLTSKGKRFLAHLLEAVLVVVTLFIGWIIWSIVLWKKGQTPAKSLLKMRVVKADEYRPLNRGDMALRELVGKFLLSVIPFYQLVSAVFVLFDDRNQAIWDKLVKSVVVDDPDNVFGL